MIDISVEPQYQDENPCTDLDLVIDISAEDMKYCNQIVGCHHILEGLAIRFVAEKDVCRDNQKYCFAIQVMHFFHDNHLHNHMLASMGKDLCVDDQNNVETSGENSENCVVCIVGALEQQLCCV